MPSLGDGCPAAARQLDHFGFVHIEIHGAKERLQRRWQICGNEVCEFSNSKEANARRSRENRAGFEI
jgi:hypothetical protein